jgi:hypothetical protein
MKHRLIWILFFCMIAASSAAVFADLIPASVLLGYGADLCKNAIAAEDRRHDVKLLDFRKESRAVETEFSQAVIDCYASPDKDCYMKHNREKTLALNKIMKAEEAEDRDHLDKLDEITTLCGKGGPFPKK